MEYFYFDMKFDVAHLSFASSSSCVTSDGGVKYPAKRSPRSRSPMLPNFVLKLARALSTELEREETPSLQLFTLNYAIVPTWTYIYLI